MKEQIALQNALKSRLESLRIRYPAYSMRELNSMHTSVTVTSNRNQTTAPKRKSMPRDCRLHLKDIDCRFDHGVSVE
jgi:hypothetical protein